MVCNSAVIYIPCRSEQSYKALSRAKCCWGISSKQRKGLCTSASPDAEHRERRREPSSLRISRSEKGGRGRVLGRTLAAPWPPWHTRPWGHIGTDWGQDRGPLSAIATRCPTGVRDTQTSLHTPKSRKCRPDGFLALESCRNSTPVKFWVQLGHRRNSYLGKMPVYTVWDRPALLREPSPGPRFPRQWLLELVRALPPPGPRLRFQCYFSTGSVALGFLLRLLWQTLKGVETRVLLSPVDAKAAVTQEAPSHPPYIPAATAPKWSELGLMPELWISALKYPSNQPSSWYWVQTIWGLQNKCSLGTFHSCKRIKCPKIMLSQSDIS